MSRMLRRLAAAVLAVLLGISGLVASPAAASQDPCPPGSGVSMDDFEVWDAPGSATVRVWSVVRCGYVRVVTFETYDISARAGRDYVGVVSRTFVFPAFATETTFTIEIIGDEEPEPDETFGVRLVSGATFADPIAIGTIRDR